VGEETNTPGAESTRLRLNDIRIVGPLLVLLLGAALLVNPSLVSAESSVGSTSLCERESFDATAGITSLPDCDPDPCDDSSALVGSPILSECEPASECPTDTPAPAPTSGPTIFTTFAATAPEECETGSARVTAPLQEIVGPIWLGAIEATEFGVVTMEFPPMLAMFVGPQGFVRVFDDNGSFVHEGRLGADRTISFVSNGSETYTVKTVLINRVKYTEVVTPS